MSLGQWLNTLNGLDHGILFAIFIMGTYISYITLEAMIEYYNNKKRHNKFRVQFRITPAVLLTLGFIYSLLLHQILKAMFDFIP